jgi:UDP-N-acetylmuramoylalanine--D-glutamate ligase
MSGRLVILGAGESGVGAALLAAKNGYEVFVSDKGNIKPEYKAELIENNFDWEESGHTEEMIVNADLVVKSPGIPDNAPLVSKLVDLGIPVISEIEFASRFTDAVKICITGSNGKTTTSMLTWHILNAAGLSVGLAGNVGHSFARMVSEDNYDYYVIELSSFQLDGMFDFRADIAIILNITPDHLDRYQNDFSLYMQSKFRILRNMRPDDQLIYCNDDEVVTKELSRINPDIKMYPFGFTGPFPQGAWIEKEEIILFINNNTLSMSLFDLSMEGKHNVYNSMAAGIASRVLDIRKETIRESLADFQGVEHRLEPVIQVHGIEFINDSKATNVNSTWYALETVKNEVVWIAGGVDKGNDYSMLLPLVKDKVTAIVCLGKDNSKIRDAFEDVIDTIVDAEDMSEAVRMAYYLSKKGTQVLLSPACASFDLFENYEDRGHQFKECVRQL